MRTRTKVPSFWKVAFEMYQSASLVRNNLMEMYTQSRKQCPLRPVFDVFLQKVHSDQRWRVRKSGVFWNPQKVKKTAPEMSKTIVIIKRYTDFLYILGDLCSSARNCHVTCNPLDLKIDPGKFTNNKVPDMV